MSLLEFIPDSTESVSLLVNGSHPRRLYDMFEEVFPDKSVTVEGTATAERDEVVLVRDGDIRARSSLESLEEAILFVNSDLYTTGATGLDELDVPDVVADLDGVPFSLRGYPEATKEKLLLIVVSRYIEQLAWQGSAGTLRSSFQRLSRIDDERGTRTVYGSLAGTETDVHVYGVPDWGPAASLDVTAHGGRSEDYRYGWFVVYRPPDREGGAALVAYETDPHEWDGVWTYEQNRVAEIAEYVRREL